MRKGRKGFSLIELLIVVAIIAALVGVAVPFFQDNLQQAQQTKAREDMDTIRNAISIHDAQNRPLTGTSLRPLLGRYLQEVPKDPWGNEYLLDAQVGIVISYGADGQSAGTGADQDLYTRYKAKLRIQRAQYEAPSWGKPNSAKIYLTMSKPYFLVSAANFEDSVELLRGANASPPTSGTAYYAYPISFTGLATIAPLQNQTWNSLLTGVNEQNNGLAIFQQTASLTSNTQMFTATMAMNFSFSNYYPSTYTSGGQTIPTSYGIGERFYPNGPMDPAIYGAGTSTYFAEPEPIDLVDLCNRGVRLEKF